MPNIEVVCDTPSAEAQQRPLLSAKEPSSSSSLQVWWDVRGFHETNQNRVNFFWEATKQRGVKREILIKNIGRVNMKLDVIWFK